MNNFLKKHLKQNDLYRFLKRNIFGYIFELYVGFTALFYKKSKKKQKFMIFSQGRSGSTLLTQLLNSHPEVYCDKEILDRDVRDPIKIINDRERSFDSSIYGFKLLVPQMMDRMGYKSVEEEEIFFSLPLNRQLEFVNKIIENGYKIIYLKRKNTLDIAISFFYARHRKIFHSIGKDYLPKMKVDIEKFSHWLHGLEICIQVAEGIMAYIPHHLIIYEDDLLDNSLHGNTVSSVYNFLGIPYVQPRKMLKKIIPKNYKEIIENYEEFDRFFLQS